MDKERERAIKICVDMAGRYDADMEGCDGDELLKYGEAMSCCFRLAYIIKYGTFPSNETTWGKEFWEQLKEIRKTDAALEILARGIFK